ncbi:hypothetical protein GLA29479_2652 [Lysobacter antibioticus]|nr:hypothetical protein GLA29479_2652 [Lysobacter antibioticus]
MRADALRGRDGARPGCDADGNRRLHASRHDRGVDVEAVAHEVDARSGADATAIAISRVTQAQPAEIFRESSCV